MNNNDKNRDNGLISSYSSYIIVSHIAFVVSAPLLLFLWGGTWLIEKLNLPEWTKIIVILLGIAVMLASLISYLYKLIYMYGQNSEQPKHVLKHTKKDNDYYAD